jgi:hypothetical protein
MESAVTDRQSSVIDVSANEAYASGVSWAAIIAGAFVVAALSLILLALGSGLGLSSVSPWRNRGVRIYRQQGRGRLVDHQSDFRVCHGWIHCRAVANKVGHHPLRRSVLSRYCSWLSSLGGRAGDYCCLSHLRGNFDDGRCCTEFRFSGRR